jgi:endonuclease/exonuclease/phosphatase family metal-dependent hydrolase
MGDDSPEVQVDHQRSIAARTLEFALGLEPWHGFFRWHDLMIRKTLRVVTYNIHRCRGLDGRTIPQRAIEVLRGLDADIIALQEVMGAGSNDSGHAEIIGAGLGMGWVMASVRHLRGHQFGNVVLSRFPITQHHQYDLSWRTCEPRACQRVDLDIDNHTLHMFNVHLGTAFRERKDQSERLATIVHDRRISTPKIVLGDFNEWSRGLATAVLEEKLQAIDLSVHLRRKRTYPGILPFLHLDHIYYEGHVDIAGVEVPRTRKSLMASDHLPFLAELKVGFE